MLHRDGVDRLVFAAPSAELASSWVRAIEAAAEHHFQHLDGASPRRAAAATASSSARRPAAEAAGGDDVGGGRDNGGPEEEEGESDESKRRATDDLTHTNRQQMQLHAQRQAKRDAMEAAQRKARLAAQAAARLAIEVRVTRTRREWIVVQSTPVTVECDAKRSMTTTVVSSRPAGLPRSCQSHLVSPSHSVALTHFDSSGSLSHRTLEPHAHSSRWLDRVRD